MQASLVEQGWREACRCALDQASSPAHQRCGWTSHIVGVAGAKHGSSQPSLPPVLLLRRLRGGGQGAGVAATLAQKPGCACAPVAAIPASFCRRCCRPAAKATPRWMPPARANASGSGRRRGSARLASGFSGRTAGALKLLLCPAVGGACCCCWGCMRGPTWLLLRPCCTPGPARQQRAAGGGGSR